MYKSFKWIMDRFLAFVALCVLSPLFLVMMLAIVLDSKGSPFIVQKRDGYKKKTIKVVKFRTMYSADFAFDVDHPVIDGKDAKVTRVGRFLRRTKLDELPQIINILKADMSFVGPRPLLPAYVERYKRWEFQKFAVKPGMTGLSQVRGNGYLTVRSRSYYDALYTEKMSLWTDFKIILMTIGVIFRGEEAFKREATDEEVEEIIRRYEAPSRILTVGEAIGGDTREESEIFLREKLAKEDLSDMEIHVFSFGECELRDLCAEKKWKLHLLPKAEDMPSAAYAFKKELSDRHFDVVHSHLPAHFGFPLSVAKELETEVRICYDDPLPSEIEGRPATENNLPCAASYATLVLPRAESEKEGAESLLAIYRAAKTPQSAPEGEKEKKDED